MEEEKEFRKFLEQDFLNNEVFTNEQHAEILSNLKICSYSDLIDKIVVFIFDISLVTVICWNDTQSKYLVKDDDDCQFMVSPTKLQRWNIHLDDENNLLGDL